ncbi:MAG: substrate-binding domain-containing protein [Gammaproteobacteria bacterium]|nr:substrate-binding domain-containing protein [Gammaproteobacteria bacterium]
MLIHRRLLFCFIGLVSFYCLNGIAAEKHTNIRLTTTTSVLNSGLLQHLTTAFEADNGYTLEVEAFGTGRALRSAREGNADVIIVHSPAAERKFMQAGHGLIRAPLMSNEFIVAGPANDPAGLSNSVDIISAFKAIASAQSRFISRGDDSGTHKKELEIWKKCNLEPYGKWYVEYGHGMGKTLLYADEMSAYILVDKGTWLAKRKLLKLEKLFDGDILLANPYHIIAINPAKHPHVNRDGAERFVEWMTSIRAQDIIRNFTIDDEMLFIPADNP